jgi:hypothetical protein
MWCNSLRTELTSVFIFVVNRHSKFEGLQAAQQLAINLIETMQQEFAQFQQQQQQQHQQQQHQNQQINSLALQQG